MGGIYDRIKDKSPDQQALVWVDEYTYPEYVHGMHPLLGPPWKDIDFVYCPINYRAHWFLVVIDLNRGVLVLYDSMPSYISLKDVTEFLEPLAHTMPSLLTYCRLKNHKPDLNEQPWKIVRSSRSDRQQNSLDCGIFACKFFEYLATGAPRTDFVQKRMTEFRRQYACQLWSSTVFF